MKKTLKFTWQQALPTPENDLAGWRLYSAVDEAMTNKKLVADIPFVTEQTDYFTDQEITVDTEGKVYFSMSAYDASGNESGLSVPTFEVFDITPPPIPMSLTITVIG